MKDTEYAKISIGDFLILIPIVDENNIFSPAMWTAKEFDYKIFGELPDNSIIMHFIAQLLPTPEKIAGKNINLYLKDSYPLADEMSTILHGQENYPLMWVVNKHYASFGTKNCIYTRFGFRNRTTVEIEQLSSDFQVIHSDKFNHSFYFTYLQWDDEVLDPENGLINIARELEEHFTRIKQTDFAGKRPTENLKDFSIELNGYTLAITLGRSFVIRDSDQAQQEVVLTNFLWENAQKTDRYNVILNFPKIEVINEYFKNIK